MKSTQTQMILGHLKLFKAITPLEALEKYGCLRLGARILDLRDAGHNIRTEIIEVQSRNGKKHVAKYVLARGKKLGSI